MAPRENTIFGHSRFYGISTQSLGMMYCTQTNENLYKETFFSVLSLEIIRFGLKAVQMHVSQKKKKILKITQKHDFLGPM